MVGRFNFSVVFLRGFLSHQSSFMTRNATFFRAAAFLLSILAASESQYRTLPAFPGEGLHVETAHRQFKTAPFLTPQNSPISN